MRFEIRGEQTSACGDLIDVSIAVGHRTGDL
jgi:hypothetical protein